MLKKIAITGAVVSGVFAAVAAGIFAPPPPPAKATGYGGYTYTQRVCQEYGQQPRWHLVRDGQAAYNGGNSDSGWLIVLVRGSGRAVTYYGRLPGTAITQSIFRNLIVHYNYPVTVGDGRTAYVWAFVPNPSSAIIDRNRDGVVNTDDAVSGNIYETIQITPPLTRYEGGPYIRWAHMAWCY